MATTFLWPVFMLLFVEGLAVADLAEPATAVDREGRILLEDNVYTIMSKLEKQEQEIAALKTEVATLKAQDDTLKTEVATLKAQRATHLERVAFKAHLTKAFTPTPNQLIVFDDVQFNVGQGYHHGTFVAPYNGTYLFSVTMCSDHGHYVIVDLLRNGKMIAQVLAGDDALADCSSETTVTELVAGDDVIVQHQGTHGDYVLGNKGVHNGFAGVLLY